MHDRTDGTIEVIDCNCVGEPRECRVCGRDVDMTQGLRVEALGWSGYSGYLHYIHPACLLGVLVTADSEKARRYVEEGEQAECQGTTMGEKIRAEYAARAAVKS